MRAAYPLGRRTVSRAMRRSWWVPIVLAFLVGQQVPAYAAAPPASPAGGDSPPALTYPAPTPATGPVPGTASLPWAAGGSRSVVPPGLSAPRALGPSAPGSLGSRGSLSGAHLGSMGPAIGMGALGGRPGSAGSAPGMAGSGPDAGSLGVRLGTSGSAAGLPDAASGRVPGAASLPIAPTPTVAPVLSTVVPGAWTGGSGPPPWRAILAARPAHARLRARLRLPPVYNGAAPFAHRGGRVRSVAAAHANSGSSSINATLQVPALTPWNDTGIDLATSQAIHITAGGAANVAPNAPFPPTGGPYGAAPSTCHYYSGQCLFFVAPGLKIWALVARIGANGTPFEVDANKVFSVPAGGRLYLGINDDNFADNSGAWTATVTSLTGALQPATNGGGSPDLLTTFCHATRSPVNCATGDFWHTFDDLAIPGRGVPLRLTHSYNSLAAGQDGPLGFGWTDSYNLFLTTDGTGAITVHEEAGSAVTFAASGGLYQAPSGIVATLVANGDGTLTFTRNKSRAQYVFGAPITGTPGQLTREVDRNGYATALAYYTGGPSYQVGKLATVTDPGGRALTFAYNAAGRIDHVTDPAGRTVRFGYNDGNGNLTDAYDVANGHWQFSYDANHLLLAMTDPVHLGQPTPARVANVYDGSARVTSQTDQMSRKTSFFYTDNGDGSQTTTITDPRGM